MNGKKHKRSNKMVGLSVLGIVCMMLGLAYASVPLYQLFCQVTGYGGTPQIAEKKFEQKFSNQTIKVRFNSDVNTSLDWKFKPVQRQVQIPLGAETLIAYRAENKGDSEVVGTATFNVTPLKVAQYFNKVDCFCFTKQKLSPGETVDMPVSFYIDPAILDDPNTKEVKTITLSYTFYKAADES